MFQIPFRQKAFILTVILLGMAIGASYGLRLLTRESLRIAIFFYSIIVPFFLLASDLLIDLDNKKVFTWWLSIGFVFLLTFLLLRDNQDLIIRPVTSDDPKYFRWIGNSAAEPLKCLPLFLLAYWILNYLSTKTRGKSLVSTYKLSKWYSDAGKRKVGWIDVLMNAILLLVIFIGIIIKI